MDEQRTQNINQAAEKLTDTARQSFQMLSDRTVSLQESNLRLTQTFFQNFMQQLQSQAVQEHSQQQRDDLETLSQEATNAYSDFLNSALSFYQETLNTASQVAQNNMQQASQFTQQGMQAGVQAASQVGQRAMEAANQSGQQAMEAANLSGRGFQQGVKAYSEGRRRSLLELAGSGSLEDEEAQDIALEAVRWARSDAERVVEGSTPRPEEVRARRAARVLAP